MPYPHASPLLAPESPLVERERQLVRRLLEREAGSASRGTALPQRAMLNRLHATLMEQPAAIRGALAAHGRALEELASKLAARKWRRIYLTGEGEAFGATFALRPLFEEMFAAPTEEIGALPFAYYGNRAIDADTLVIGVDGSGECPRTIESLLIARARGALTIAITAEGSSLAEHSDDCLPLNGGTLIAGLQVMALLMQLALDHGSRNGVATERIGELQRAFALLPEQMKSVLDQVPAMFDGLDASGTPIRLIAEGPAFAAAWTGATLLDAWCGQPAWAGPVKSESPLGSLTILILPNGLTERLARIAAQSIAEAGGRLWALVAEDNSSFEGLAEQVIALPAMVERLCAPVYTLPVQALALHLARHRLERSA